VVCGAPNAAQNQKVILAKAGSTIYPLKGEPVTMRVAKIRGVESFGMICAEDEIGVGESHAGIIVLPDDTPVGIAAAELYELYEDYVYEIGLTPNRMDAMSHIGVAKDVSAYLSHHGNKDVRAHLPYINNFKSDSADFYKNICGKYRSLQKILRHGDKRNYYICFSAMAAKCTVGNWSKTY